MLLLIDLVSFATAFSLLPTFHPPTPSARPVLSALTRLRQNPELWINVVLGIAIATFGAGLASFVLERTGGHKWVESGTSEGKVPSYLLSDQLTTGEILSVRGTPFSRLLHGLTVPSFASFMAHSTPPGRSRPCGPTLTTPRPSPRTSCTRSSSPSPSSHSSRPSPPSQPHTSHSSPSSRHSSPAQSSCGTSSPSRASRHSVLARGWREGTRLSLLWSGGSVKS